jgi:aminoglycoside N3'-acetyltransferase
MYSIEKLANDFRKLGIAAGDTVMLHASVRAIGEVAGGPDAIHLALKSALTPEGTLMNICLRQLGTVANPIRSSGSRQPRPPLVRINILTVCRIAQTAH